MSSSVVSLDSYTALNTSDISSVFTAHNARILQVGHPSRIPVLTYSNTYYLSFSISVYLLSVYSNTYYNIVVLTWFYTVCDLILYCVQV